MQAKSIFRTLAIFVISGFFSVTLQAQADGSSASITTSGNGNMILLFIILAIVFVAVIFLKIKTSEVVSSKKKKNAGDEQGRLNRYISNMDSKQIDAFMQYKQTKKDKNKSSGGGIKPALLTFFFLAK